MQPSRLFNLSKSTEMSSINFIPKYPKDGLETLIANFFV